MFTTLAALRRDGRRHAAPVTPVHANDNRLDDRLAPRRARRQVLRCRWRSLPATGRLECHWEIADIDDTSAEEPGIRVEETQVRGRLAVCLPGERSRMQAVA